MSIATRINAIEEHIGNAYNKLEDIGVDLTGIDKNINNIATQLEQVYNDYPKVTASNVEETSLSNTKAGRMGIDLKGNTSQGENPSPTNPQTIHTVNGNNTITIANANLCDEELEQGTISSTGISGGDLARIRTKNFQKVNPNTQYTFNLSSQSNISVYVFEYSTNNENSFIQRIPSNWTVVPYTFTTSATTEYIKIVIKRDEYTISVTDVSDIMLNVGSTDITYIPHAEQNLPIDLGDIELAEIGTAEDYIYKENDKWYLHKGIGETKLQNIVNLSSGTVFGTACKYGVYGITGLENQSGVSGKFFCNKVKYANGVWAKYSGYLITTNFVILSDNDETVENFNSNISGSILQFPLATPTNTEITQTTLINQLEAIRNSKSYNEVTNISQTNNDLPFILDLAALRGE